MHFCSDELFAILQAVPFLRHWATRLSLWWHSKKVCVHNHPKVVAVNEGKPMRSAVNILRDPPKLNFDEEAN